MSYDLSKLSVRQMATLKVIASCSKLKEAARLLHRGAKTMTSQKRAIKDILHIETDAEWDQLCAQVRGQRNFTVAHDSAATLFPEIWSQYVGVCSLLSRLQRLVTDGDEAELIDQAIHDCAALSDGRLRVIRITNGVALEPVDARLDTAVQMARGKYGTAV